MTPKAFDFSVPVDHPSLPGHFPGRPIVPGVVLLDEVMSGLNRSGCYRVAKLREVKFLATMLPGEIATARWDVIDGVHLAFEVSVTRNGTLTVLAKGSFVLRDVSS